MALRAYTFIDMSAKETFLSILVWFLSLARFTLSDAHMFLWRPHPRSTRMLCDVIVFRPCGALKVLAWGIKRKMAAVIYHGKLTRLMQTMEDKTATTWLACRLSYTWPKFPSKKRGWERRINSAL